MLMFLSIEPGQSTKMGCRRGVLLDTKLAANMLTLSEVHSLGRELRRRPFDLVRSASKAQRPTPACAPLAPNIC